MANATKKTKKDKPAIVETKSQKFVRLATARTTKACKAIYQVGMLGSNVYESTPEQREKIAEALNAAVQSTLNKLNKETVKPTGFTL